MFIRRCVISSILIALMLLLSSGIVVKAEDNEVKFLADSIHPGEFLQVVANEPPNSIVKVKFLNKTKELLANSDRYIGFLAVSYYVRPGVYPLTVTVSSGTESHTREYLVEILKRDYPEDRIRVPEKTRKTILTTDNRNSDTVKATTVREKAMLEALPPLWERSFSWPLKGRLTTDFGLIRYVNDIENGRHSGLDLAAPTGTPVSACSRGKVIFADKLYLTGLTVIIHHGMDLFTTYGHLSKINIKEGEMVEEGATIGLVGSTGLATGPHLHLTFRIGETAVDPFLFLGKEIKWE